MNSQDKRLLMEQWYRQYAALIFHYARQFTDHHSAEETVQETFRELEYDGLVSRQDLHLLKRLAVDGFTYAEAARELNTTAEACRKRAARAKRHLRELLD